MNICNVQYVGLVQAPYLTLSHVATGPDLKYETDVSIDVCFDQNEELTQRDDKHFYAYRIEVRRIAEQFRLIIKFLITQS